MLLFVGSLAVDVMVKQFMPQTPAPSAAITNKSVEGDGPIGNSIHHREEDHGSNEESYAYSTGGLEEDSGVRIRDISEGREINVETGSKKKRRGDITQVKVLFCSS